MPETGAAERQRRYREKQRSKDPEGFKERTASYKRDLRRRKAAAKSTEPKEPDRRSTRERPERLERQEPPEPTRSRPSGESRRKQKQKPHEVQIVMRPATPPPPPKGSVEPAKIHDCDDLEQKIRERRDRIREFDPTARAPTDRTIRASFNRVKLLYRQMFGRNFACNDWDWTRDTKRVLDFISNNERWTTEASRNTHRAALASILRNMVSFEETARIYGHETTQANKIIEKEVGENNLRGSARANYLNWEDLARKVMRVPPGTVDSALTAMYTFAPPRRLADYCAMRLVVGVTADHLKTLDPAGNYLSVDRHMTPGDFCFNVYKTSAAFGQQIIAVHPHVAPLLKQYLVRESLRDGDLLFPDYRGRPHTNFSRFVAQTFERWTGKPMSVDLLRHSFVTYALDKRPTLNERKQLAWEMAHSQAVQATYEVLDPHLEPSQRQSVRPVISGLM